MLQLERFGGKWDRRPGLFVSVHFVENESMSMRERDFELSTLDGETQ